MAKQHQEIHPVIGEYINLKVEVIWVKYTKNGTIKMRVKELITNQMFVLEYKQNLLYGMEGDNEAIK